MRQNQQTQQFRPRTDVDLALERRGTMGDITEADRAAFIRVAEMLGCHTAAQHILDDRRRRNLVHAAPVAAPRPGPKPKPTPARPPLLRVLVADGEVEGEVDDRASFYLRMALLADEALSAPWAGVSERVESAALARDLRAAAYEHLAARDEEPSPPSAA